MKQQGMLAIVLVIVAVRGSAATARSSKTLRSSRGTLSEAAQQDSSDFLESAAGDRSELLSRLSKAESLTGIERKALQAQQRVLLALEQQQETLESRVHRLEANELAGTSQSVVVENGIVSKSVKRTAITRQQAKKEHHPEVYEVAAKKTARKLDADQPSKPEGAGFFIYMKESEKEFWTRYNKAFWEKMTGIAFYLAQIFLVAFLYMSFCKHSAAPKLPESQVRTEEFQYGVFDASDLLRDNQICLCALCCPWIRWADTASNPTINFLAFVPALFITALLSSAGTVTFGCSIPILILILVICRQRIRDAYGLPSGTCAILLGDCLLWTCCPCCAIVQESRQVEYVDVPMQDSYGHLPSQA